MHLILPWTLLGLIIRICVLTCSHSIASLMPIAKCQLCWMLLTKQVFRRLFCQTGIMTCWQMPLQQRGFHHVLQGCCRWKMLGFLNQPLKSMSLAVNILMHSRLKFCLSRQMAGMRRRLDCLDFIPSGLTVQVHLWSGCQTRRIISLQTLAM